jgi:hypothetical protein
MRRHLEEEVVEKEVQFVFLCEIFYVLISSVEEANGVVAVVVNDLSLFLAVVWTHNTKRSPSRESLI